MQWEVEPMDQALAWGGCKWCPSIHRAGTPASGSVATSRIHWQLSHSIGTVSAQALTCSVHLIVLMEKVSFCACIWA